MTDDMLQSLLYLIETFTETTASAFKMAYTDY